MTRGFTTRRLQVFSLQIALRDGTQANYHSFFKHVFSHRENRSLEIGDRVIIIPKAVVTDATVSFKAYEGERGIQPIIFNTETDAERVAKLERAELLVTTTHAIINLRTREAIVEYNHRGAKASQLADVLEHVAPMASKDYVGIHVSLTPVVDEEFVKAISNFSRIRVASVKLAEPNQDWYDDHHELTKIAGDSGGKSIAVQVFASRAQSLDSKKGIIPLLKKWISKATSPVEAASVTGTRGQESSETTISLAHHIEHQRVSVRLEEGRVVEEDIEDRMRAFLTDRSNRGGPNV
jgi:hypothetical protein